VEDIWHVCFSCVESIYVWNQLQGLLITMLPIISHSTSFFKVCFKFFDIVDAKGGDYFFHIDLYLVLQM